MTVNEAASFWLVKLDADTLEQGSQRAFEAWLAADPAHREVFDRTQCLWDNFEQAADPSELRALRAAALAVTPVSSRRPRIAAIAAVAAVAALCTMAGLSAWHLRSPSSPQADAVVGSVDMPLTERYSTARNERTTVTLSDGSVVTLNLATALEVTFTPTERFVRITQGQAFFEVAKNPHRPFVVAAADRRVTAIGTQFDVRLDPDRIEVVLLEGQISVDSASPTVLERLTIRKAHVVLTPGEKLVAALGRPVTITQTNAPRATSWRQGWVVFENQTVGDAIAELNRYSDHPLIVADESVRNLHLSGVFRLGQPDRFATIIQELLPVKAVAGTHGETLLIPTNVGPKPPALTPNEKQ